MANKSQTSQNDKIFKRINDDARYKANQRGKKEQEEIEKSTTQMRL